MKKIKKLISLVLCVCMVGYAFPVFAVQTEDGADLGVQKIMLSDADMSQLVGAGTVDAKVSDYSAGEQATAVFANRSTLSSSYALVETSANGGIVNTIASGPLPSNSAIIVSGDVLNPAGGYVIRADISVDAFPSGIHATDAFMH